MNIKKMILSGGMLVFVAAVVVGGTGAFFSDTETSTGNVFTAGSVSIGFGGIDHVYAYGDGSDPVEGYFTTTTANNIPRFAFDDLKPRDAGRLTFDLDNGANDAYVCGLVTGTAPTTDPDQALYDNLQFYDADDNQVTFGSWFDLGAIDANGTGEYEIDYCFGDGQGTACNVVPGTDYNAAQNGSFSADLVLYAVQQRNNDDFSCDDLEMVEGEPVITQPEIVTYESSVLNYSSTGWGGWSCTEGTAVGGTVLVDGDPINPTLLGAEGVAEPDAVVGGETYPVFPHHTFNDPDETGYVAQMGGTVPSGDVTIEVQCQVN